jgi:dipeptidyl aminopeptidase/acylaminoacyl peptidase
MRQRLVANRRDVTQESDGAMMRWNACFARIVVGVTCACFAASLSAAPPPAEAFGTIPAESDLVISRQGHWLAWLDHKEGKPRVVMFDLPGRKVQRILAVPEDTKVRSLYWQDEETLLVVLSQTKESKSATLDPQEFFRTIAHDVGGGKGRMLPVPDGKLPWPMPAVLIATHTAKPKTVVMFSLGQCKAVPRCLMDVDTRTGKGTPVTFGTAFTVNWVVDHNGHAVAREDWDYKAHEYRVIALRGESVMEILRRPDSEPVELSGTLADGSAVVLLAANGRVHTAAWALPLDGSPLRLLAEDPDQDISSVYYDSITHALVGVYVSGTKQQVRWLDPEAQQRFDRLQRAFAGREVVVYGWTEDGQKTLAYVQAPSSPPIYYVVDFAAHRADIAAEEYPALAGVPLGEVKQISYKARDGTPIPAYLTLPVGYSAGPVPMVVLPHGGPQARDFFAFDWFAQFLASRGYAVLQPQFRGSTGFGDAFREAGYRQWGGLMQDDVTDGVRAMTEQNIADPHRICIVGISYGGYAALAGATFTPDLYSCAISISGITDLPALMRRQVPIYEGTQSTILAFWKTHIGAPNDKNLVVKSPINSIGSIKAPVLLVYGTGDSVVPNEQSIRMAEAMRAAKKSVEVTVLPHEDHWLSRTDTRVQVLKEAERFLKEHL